MLKKRTAFVFMTLLFAAPAAYAGEATEPYSFELDLSEINSDAGARAIYGDIRRQATRLCGFHARPPRNDRRAETACRAEVVNNAVAQVDSRRLTDLHNAESDAQYATG